PRTAERRRRRSAPVLNPTSAPSASRCAVGFRGRVQSAEPDLENARSSAWDARPVPRRAFCRPARLHAVAAGRWKSEHIHHRGSASGGPHSRCAAARSGGKKMSLAIDVQNVTRVFESKKKEPFYALRDANLQVQRGEMFGLLGPNGAGKSTLIKILSTLLLPTSGTARVAGFDVVREADRVRRSINMVSGGEHSGYGILTVRESLWLFSQFHGVPSREALRRIDEALEIVG